MSVSLVVRLMVAERPSFFAGRRPAFFAMDFRARAIEMPSGSDLAPFYQGFLGFATAAEARLH
jgi:hypothetical protein